jgi:hypothetical protein
MHIYFTPKAGAEVDDEYRMQFARHIRETVQPVKTSLNDVSCLCDYRKEGRTNYYPPLKKIRGEGWPYPEPEVPAPESAMDASGDIRDVTQRAISTKDEKSRSITLDLGKTGDLLSGGASHLGAGASTAAAAIGGSKAYQTGAQAASLSGDLLIGGLEAGVATAGAIKSGATMLDKGAGAVVSVGGAVGNFLHRRRLLSDMTRNVTCFCHNGELKFDKENNVDDIMNGFEQGFDPSEAGAEHSGCETLITTPLEGGKSKVVPVLSTKSFKVGEAVTIGHKSGTEPEETRGIVSVGEKGIPFVTLNAPLVHDHSAGSMLHCAPGKY